ncbi:hypothetical protein INR49_012897 [Caranx melampygus]|nr:hypothetical protein INR49_012897 [Caranx melampygus]
MKDTFSSHLGTGGFTGNASEKARLNSSAQQGDNRMRYHTTHSKLVLDGYAREGVHGTLHRIAADALHSIENLLVEWNDASSTVFEYSGPISNRTFLKEWNWQPSAYTLSWYTWVMETE